MRADQLLLQRNIASSRSQAQRLIASGVRWRAAEHSGKGPEAAWKPIAKNSDDVPLDAQIDLLDASEARYVSRGGLKLAGALQASGVQAKGKLCLDVGQSTGGFTDCLLQHGAQFVFGLDVGSGQLHPSLRDHPQVLAIEKVNARELSADFFDVTNLVANYSISVGTLDDFASARSPKGVLEDSFAGDLDGDFCQTGFDLIVGDLSFISQTLVLPALVPLLKPGGDLLTLVKPQFELQPGQVGKGGIVKNPDMYPVVEKRLRDTCAMLGLAVNAWLDSPILGGDGNREFFMHARKLAKPG